MISTTRVLHRCGLAMVCLTLLLSRAAGQVPIYTSANPPPTPALESLPLQNSVTKDGITWTFSAAARVGQFVNGDYYVVGPVTVTAISPSPANGRNGSVLNLPNARPGNLDKTGFDDRTGGSRYSASLRVNLPVQLTPGDALTSSISVDTIGSLTRVMRPEDATNSPVRSCSVLYSLSAPVPPDTFRPSYVGRQTEFHYARNLRRDLLPRLARVSGTPALSQFAGYFRRPWVDTLYFGFDAPIEYMPDYGREVGRAVGNAALLLMVDYPEADREALLVYFVQYGIDLFGVVSAGHPGWHAHGGHGSGRKLPILFAGAMLGDSRFYALTGKNFGEDMQTIIATGAPNGPGWTGATALYAGHKGVNGERDGRGWGPYEHLQPSAWLDPIGEDYRRCCTSICWVGQVLAARLIGIQQAWNHPPLFAYIDRWMTEDDTAHLATIRNQTGHDFSASFRRQGQAWDTFVNNMWRSYASLPAPTVPASPSNLQGTPQS